MLNYNISRKGVDLYLHFCSFLGGLMEAINVIIDYQVTQNLYTIYETWWYLGLNGIKENQVQCHIVEYIGLEEIIEHLRNLFPIKEMS